MKNIANLIMAYYLQTSDELFGTIKRSLICDRARNVLNAIIEGFNCVGKPNYKS